MKYYGQLICGLVMLAVISIISLNLNRWIEPEKMVLTDSKAADRPFVVVLDAGHGGMDSGKTGINGYLEKDINLNIVRLLKSNLEASDVKVILTRTDGNGLYTENDVHKKHADMEKRISIIENEKPDAVVSIHQNSYQTEEVHGPQVFFYKGSSEGERLATILQASFNGVVGKENNTRVVKPNSDYYLLLHTSCPTVICECGFLSNRKEADLLVSENYQKRIAWSLHIAIMQYLLEES